MRKLTSLALAMSLSWPAAALPELTLGPAAQRVEKRLTVDRVIAVVEGIPIFSSQLAMLLRGTERTLGTKPGQADKKLLRQAARAAYQSLIEQALIEAAGALAGEQVSDEEVQQAIERWAPRYWAWREQAAGWGMSGAEYDRAIRIALLEQRLLTRYIYGHPWSKPCNGYVRRARRRSRRKPRSMPKRGA